jgi:hypothetical protein
MAGKEAGPAVGKEREEEEEQERRKRRMEMIGKALILIKRWTVRILKCGHTEEQDDMARMDCLFCPCHSSFLIGTEFRRLTTQLVPDGEYLSHREGLDDIFGRESWGCVWYKSFSMESAHAH